MSGEAAVAAAACLWSPLQWTKPSFAGGSTLETLHQLPSALVIDKLTPTTAPRVKTLTTSLCMDISR
jgi:hypothetical protein